MNLFIERAICSLNHCLIKKNSILCLVLSHNCIETISNRDVKIILYYYNIKKKMFAYSRLKGTVTKTAVLTLWIIIEKTENEQYFFIKTILGVDNFTNNIDLSEKIYIIKKWIKMTPLNICVCFCWACSSSVELSFNSNLVLRQSELLLLISPSVGRFMQFYHNKWESFITPDTTRLKRICGVTVCIMYIPYCLI